MPRDRAAAGALEARVVDEAGGLLRADASRCSFVDLEELRRLLRNRASLENAARLALLREIEMALSAGVGAVNLSTLEGLADELFTYAGSGTLFTRERYVIVRRLGADDYDAAADLIARGVAEGYLVPRTPEEVERIFVSALRGLRRGAPPGRDRRAAGASRGGRGRDRLTLHPDAFPRRGDRGPPRAFRARARAESKLRLRLRLHHLGARGGLLRATGLPIGRAGGASAEKWHAYDPDRRGRVRCLRCDL